MIQMVKSNFVRHFQFDLWANQLFLNFLKENELEEKKIYSIFGHIMSAQILWLKRIVTIEIEDYPLWKTYSVEELGQMINSSNRAWKNFIEQHPDDNFGEIISYTNTKGQPYNTSLKEIIEHVLYHGVYHRGQLAILIRQSGLTPPYTDFIAFVREHPH